MSGAARRFILCEIPGRDWTLEPILAREIDPDHRTVRDWLRDIGVDYHRGYVPGADLYVEPESFETIKARTLLKRIYLVARRLFRPAVVVIGEPYEYSKLAYWTSSPARTLSVAPGDRFERIFYPTDIVTADFATDWESRLDRIAWIARPYPWRVALARRILEAGVPLDVYSRYDWGLPCWKGPADSVEETFSKYRYAISGENFSTHGCHTEKLSHALYAGCVPFYGCDPALDIPEVRGTWAPLTVENMVRRHELAGPIRAAQREFFASGKRGIYSPREFWSKILRKGLTGREDRYPELARSIRSTND